MCVQENKSLVFELSLREIKLEVVHIGIFVALTEESIKIMKVVKRKAEYCQEILKVIRNLK